MRLRTARTIMRQCRLLLLLLGLASLLVPAGPRPTAAAGEPVLRDLLALYDSSEFPPGGQFVSVRLSLIHTMAEMPLNWLGLRLRYLDVRTERLPSDDEMRRYRGIITWFQDDRLTNPEGYLDWLRRQLAAGRRVVILGTLGAGSEFDTGQPVSLAAREATYRAMGLELDPVGPTDNPRLLSIRHKVPEMVEFERTLDGELFQLTERIRSSGPANKVYLTINRSDLLNGDSDVVVTGPWGGLALAGFEFYEQPRTFAKRWRINPFAFFEEALGLQGIPRPDVSTLNGSRVLYTHVDGDGFNNITEIDYTSLSAEVILERFVKVYDLPFTISIVVNDIDPAVLGGARQVDVARTLFAQPNVEGASHTYTHPFDWSKPVDLDREVRAAIEYLNTTIAPPDRPVRLILWSGSTNPQEGAIARADSLGLLNINGGDPRFDQACASYTCLASLTTTVGQRTQYYTSNANDNIYGNDWTGPYYGLRNVLETWRRTESPRRIGAMNIYYHIFTGEKRSAVQALSEVYDAALKMEVAPVYATDYLQFVKGFLSTEITREGDAAWRVRNNGALRTLRLDNEGRFPDLARSQNVIGFRQYQGSLYLYLGDAPESLIALTPAAPATPYVALASHRIVDWRVNGASLSLAVEGVGRKTVSLAGVRPNADIEVVVHDQSGSRRERLRSDNAGVVTWRSLPGRGPTTGRIALEIPNSQGAQSVPIWSGLKAFALWITGR